MWQWLWSHRTKILGYFGVVMGTLAVADPTMLANLIGNNGVRWVVLINGILTALVGHHNSRKTVAK